MTSKGAQEEPPPSQIGSPRPLFSLSNRLRQTDQGSISAVRRYVDLYKNEKLDAEKKLTHATKEKVRRHRLGRHPNSRALNRPV